MKSRNLSFPCLLTLLLLSACQPATMPTPTLSSPILKATSSPTNTRVPSTATASPTAVPTSTPEPTPTSTPSPTEVIPVKITIVYDNNPYDPRLATAWGFSALVEFMDHTILFDTGGDSPTLLNNMRIMEVDLTAIEMVVLSHAHGDHTGGLEGLLAEGVQPMVHLLPSFSRAYKDRIRRITAISEVQPGQLLAPGIYTTGQMGTRIPEQALAIKTSRGLIVITGCAHPGVVQMAERAQELLGGPIYLVMGGFHLVNSSSSQIDAVVAGFRRLDVEKAAPCHCSGNPAIQKFRLEYGEDFIQVGVGCVLEFEP
ncbi:MAG TPA: MBL fold metallo-hydrolase [Anaerolineae bacterium]|nr:MBL fold metallo-hydrolase [Anaerolineae bacterium]